ncbi:ABC transporter permease [Gorillibacterium timonense]|uniref:ABC transporter permease n=1 Tax=Gorillibacterium timonense TaxID=1689269 RepID=UPI00292A485E|nr:ABC transporter permease [Gorillibacterium timonense]
MWQAAVSLFATPGWVLPSPLQILHEGINVFPRLWMHTESTIGITLAGFTVGSLTGIAVACLLHAVPGMKEGFYPLLILSQNIPTVALAPLLVVWFGFGLLPKLILITLVCFFPVSVALLGGFARTDEAMMDYFRMSGANKRQIFFKLEFPNALPALFSGLKISATYSVMGAVISEWMGAEKGIGVFMMNAKATYRADRMFVAIFMVVFISMALFALVGLLEKAIVRPAVSRKEDSR